MVGAAGVGLVTPIDMPAAVRAYAVRDGARRPGQGGRFTEVGPSGWTLTFDCETTVDTGQGLRIGAYQLRYRGRLREEGLFYEPATLTPAEMDVLAAYAKEHSLALRLREEFVEEVFLRTAWTRRGLIVGHNLPYDLVQISISHHPPQSGGAMMRGGFSLVFRRDPNASRVQIKRSNAGAAFIRLTIPGGSNPEHRNRQRGGRGKNHHGYFIDTATLGGALLGGRPSLKGLARLLGTEHQKSEETHGEEITDCYLDYARNDVQVTWECWSELKARYERFGLPTPPWKVHSEASIGKAHLNKIELDPFRVLNDWSPHVLAAVMETYYGGRAECSIRRVAMPGVYLDFTSQYPTVFVLQGLQRFLTAQRVAFHEQDPQHAQHLLERLTVEDVLDEKLWREELTALALVAPDGDRLPTRAKYNARQPRRDGKHKSGSYNVGVPYRYGGPPQWYTLADCAASKLMTGKAPRILKVLRFTTGGTQPGLQPIDVAGDPRYRVDPREQDFIARLVEMRADAKTDKKQAQHDGELERAAFLDSSQQAMKATANATSYGSAIELNPTEHRKGAWVTIHLPEGSSRRAKVDRTEEPGKWFHPLIATLVSAGGRLLLVTAMRLIKDQGGSHVFCDTDGIFVAATQHGHLIPCPGGRHQTNEGLAAVRALSWPQVQRVVDRFTHLDPYTGNGHPKSILKIEYENYDPDTGRQRRIECWAIAAKRYGIFVRRSDGAPLVIGSGDKRKRSEHGLGHLLPPYARSPDLSDRAWLDEWWEQPSASRTRLPRPPRTRLV